MLRARTVFASELVIALLLGSAPVILVLLIGDVEQITGLVQSMVAPAPIIYYLFVLTVIYPVAWALDHFIFPDHRGRKYAVAFIVYCLQQAGAGTLGIYRVVAGLSLGFAGLWLGFERRLETLPIFWDMVGLGIGSLLVACALSRGQGWFNQNTSDPLSRLQKNSL